MTSCL